MTALALHRAEVVGRETVSAGMVRLTFGGAGLAGWTSTGCGDEFVRLFFPDETGELVVPDVDERGHWHYPEGKKPSHVVPYTIRRVDAGNRTIDIDFVVHDHGRASEWAQAAKTGDAVMINSPAPIYECPADARWLLLVCDATGLPALGRLIEDAPLSLGIRAIAEIPDGGHRQRFERPGLRITWIEGSGNGIGPSRLEAAVRGTPLPTDPGYIWVAGEQRTVRPIRRYLRHELKLAANRYCVTGYWTDKGEEWERIWEELDPAIRAQIEAAWDSDRDSEEIADDVEAMYEKVGL